MRNEQLRHQFADYIPERLEEGVLYISMEYMTVTHLCCCGCGQEVSTTLSPTDWRLIYDGKTISLEPSIGSWNLPCQSHYFITRSRVIWARHWSNAEIHAGRQYDAARKFQQRDAEAAERPISVPEQDSLEQYQPKKGWLPSWLSRWWS